jgi:hypothetical protein
MKMWSVCAHTVDEDVERVLRQMGEGIPIDIWSGKTNCMPGTVVGMREWQDVSIAARFRRPPPAPLVSTQLATRADWTLDLGVMLCVGAAGDWMNVEMNVEVDVKMNAEMNVGVDIEMMNVKMNEC